MISVFVALERVLIHSDSLELYRINLSNSLGFYLAKNILSPINMPPFRQAAVDGYALCINNTQNYTIVDTIKAGDGHQPKLKLGKAVRIFTGAAVPDTANTVIPQERVVVNDTNIQIQGAIMPHDNIRSKGEQVNEGDIALKKGSLLTPAAIGYLSSLGITEIEVFKSPNIAIIVTGDELVEAGQPLTYGKIYESNALMLSSALEKLGYNKPNIYKVKDDYQNTLKLLDNAISNHDLVLVAGGISVGDYDFVGKALKALEVDEVFYKVSQKPGKPLFFGKKNKTTIFALPGNPAAALTCFYVYVRLALQKMAGGLQTDLEKIQLPSASIFTKKGNRAQFLKAFVNNNSVSLLEGQSSAMLHTFALANALVFIPEKQTNICIGDLVDVILLPR